MLQIIMALAAALTILTAGAMATQPNTNPSGPVPNEVHLPDPV